MSDEESIPPKRAERTGRAAVEIRVIGGGTVDARHRESARYEWDEDEHGDPASEAEEVTRLDQGSGPLANRRLEDEERMEPAPLARGKQRLSLWGLTMLMAGLAIMVAVSLVFLALHFRKGSPDEQSIVEVLGVVDDKKEEDAADGEDLKDAEKIVRNTIEVFNEYYKAKSVDEVVGLIRNGERLRSLLEERWKPMGTIGEVIANVVNVDGERFVILSGRDSEDMVFEIMFIPKEEEVELDWEASLAVGDVVFDELKGIEPGRIVKMRVMLGSSNFHPLEYPDDEFRCYQIWVPGFESSVYGYARKDSDVVESLSNILNEGTVLMSQAAGAMVIVNLKNGGRGEFGQFEISDVLQNGWIEP
jgi:hypothetical protein